jgi:hypothetical protein
MGFLQNSLHLTMLRYFHSVSPIAFWLVWMVMQGSPAFSDGLPAEKKRFSIHESSELYLEGTTNVNSFRCNCEDRFAPLSVNVEGNASYRRFSDARLKITTRKFNCHNSKMDRDMYKALQADAYPAIQIELLENWNESKSTKADAQTWFEVKAKVKITITHVTKEQYVVAKCRLLSKDNFELLGNKEILMSEYGIDPPEAMFGMIKVHDRINFHFHLMVHLGD